MGSRLGCCVSAGSGVKTLLAYQYLAVPGPTTRHELRGTSHGGVTAPTRRTISGSTRMVRAQRGAPWTHTTTQS